MKEIIKEKWKEIQNLEQSDSAEKIKLYCVLWNLLENEYEEEALKNEYDRI